MAKKRYVVTLTANERSYLESLVRKGKAAARKQVHARILLKSDTGTRGDGWTDEHICEALDVSRPTVERVRKRFVEEGLEAALCRREQINRKRRKLDGDGEAHLVALTCGKPPRGRVRWTLRLLANRIVELGWAESISHEAVRQTLKKRSQAVVEATMVSQPRLAIVFFGSSGSRVGTQ